MTVIFLRATEESGDFTGDRLTYCWSIPKWVNPSFVCFFSMSVYILFYLLFITSHYVVYMFVWIPSFQGHGDFL